MSFKKDEDIDVGYSFDKSTILQEARAFNETPINPRKCRHILTKIAHLLAQSESVTANEATDVFFSITKLFQCPDTPLRQMVYLLIKELSGIANDVIMVTSSLTKDINSKEDVVYRPNAIRALCKITDGTMLQSIERFMKQAIVDRNTSVSSAALVSSISMFSGTSGAKDVIKRWSNEVQESMQGKGVIAQYHALGLLYMIKQNDRISVVKLVQNYAKPGALKSPFAHCMLIRYCVTLYEEDSTHEGNTAKAMLELLESWLRHKNDMVVYEAARSICFLSNLSQSQLFPAVSALQLLLLNHKPTLRFAAVRTLNKLAMIHPVAVWPCNLDMENLITDTNRSIATFAITTLLKTGTEASVDRLMKQISGFMSEISEEFKIIVIDAIRALCLKFPTKQGLTLNFLSTVLRDEGGYEYKKAIIEAIFDIIYHVPESREYALSHLCEFIEDCEFTKLAVRILHLMGNEGPKTPTPSKYIRFIYNRVILENSVVRAAAVSALAKFAVKAGQDDLKLKERIKVLLNRCLDDVDDEVRDRAAMYLKLLDNEGLCSKFVADDSVYSWAALERNLQVYLEGSFNSPFDITSTPIVTKDQEELENIRIKAAQQENAAHAPIKSVVAEKTVAVADVVDLQYSQVMERIPELASLGPIFKSSKPVELTESETEYVVSCVKHVFNKHIVFQFNCKNTLQECVLEKVTVSMEMQPIEEDEEQGATLVQKFTLPIKKLEFEHPNTVYVVWELEKQNAAAVVSASFSNILKFLVKEVDVTTGELEEDGYEDEYLLEDLELTLADYNQPLYIPDFRKAWDECGTTNQVVETYSLTAVQGVKAAVTTLIDLLGMQPCDQTQNIKEKATTHTLLLAGTFIGSVKVLVRCRIAYDPSSGVTLEIGVRSGNREVSERIANCIQ